MKFWHLGIAATVLVGAHAVVFTVMRAPLAYTLAIWGATAFWVAATIWFKPLPRPGDHAGTPNRGRDV